MNVEQIASGLQLSVPETLEGTVYLMHLAFLGVLSG